MDKMIKSAGDQASEVALEVRGRKGIKGRHIIFTVLESFRTYDRLDLVFGVEHLHKLAYPGDKKMGDFKQRWLEPQEEELRDTLYRKLNGNSKELELDLKLYEHMERSGPAKTHKYLLNMIDRRVKATREEKNWENKEKSLKIFKLGSALQRKGKVQTEGEVGGKGRPKFGTCSS